MTEAGPGDGNTRFKRSILEMSPTLLVVLGILVVRIPPAFSPILMNPDEAELLMAGRQAAVSLIPYDEYSTTNFGFLWPTLLGLGTRVGLLGNFTQLHLLSSALLVCTVVAAMSAVPPQSRIQLAVIVGPVVAAWAAGGLPERFGADYLSLSTEIASLTPLAVGWAMVRRSERGRGVYRAGLAVIGLAPWFKYQAVPVSGVLVLGNWFFAGASVTVTPLAERLRRLVGDLGWLGAGVLAPGIVLVLTGSFDDFVRESLVFASRYASGRVDGFGPSPLERLEVFASMLLANPFLLLVLGSLSVLVLAESVRSASGRTAWSLSLGTMVIVGGGFFASGFPGGGFQHYTQYTLLAAMLAATGVVSHVCGAERALDLRRLLAASSAPVVVAGLLIAGSALPKLRADLAAFRFGNLTAPAPSSLSPSATDEIRVLCPAGSRVLVWGWSPNLYIEFDWTPALRQPHSLRSTRDPGAGDWASQDVIDGITDARTRCVVEAIGPSFFGGFAASDSIAATLGAEAASALEQGFVRQPLGSAPGAVWSRR